MFLNSLNILVPFTGDHWMCRNFKKHLVGLVSQQVFDHEQDSSLRKLNALVVAKDFNLNHPAPHAIVILVSNFGLLWLHDKYLSSGVSRNVLELCVDVFNSSIASVAVMVRFQGYGFCSLS